MKKLNNKGFSLVELIIVIAIMAILVGVVGTQVIPYLENSRKAKDVQVLSSWNTAAMSAYSNAAAKISATANYTITITANDPCTVGVASSEASDGGVNSIENYFKELTNITSFDISSMESKAGKDIDKVTIVINAAGDMTLITTNKNPGKYSFDVIESK